MLFPPITNDVCLQIIGKHSVFAAQLVKLSSRWPDNYFSGSKWWRRSRTWWPNMWSSYSALSITHLIWIRTSHTRASYCINTVFTYRSLVSVRSPLFHMSYVAASRQCGKKAENSWTFVRFDILVHWDKISRDARFLFQTHHHSVCTPMLELIENFDICHS